MIHYTARCGYVTGAQYDCHERRNPGGLAGK